MVGYRGAGVLGATVIIAGGVAYLVWRHTGKKPKSRPETESGARREGEEAEGRREERPAERLPATPAPPVIESAGTQVLVLGLDGAGKTSLLCCWATGSPEADVTPTQGFNAVSINRDDLHVDFLEIGGKEELRPYWQRYMSKAITLVFVVDSSSQQLFPVAEKLLHELLASDPHLPLMVLANKQDLPGACSITEVHDGLNLAGVGDRKLFLIGTCTKAGQSELSSGVQDAHDLIVHLVNDRR
ncbi:ADP-ribosylation factor-like protein 9 isoform X2 [Nelusetta ayraudi]|uniref:ADP-ribosylation factor-like protein 9 isoform X2 n=1 Tax=Nelusetta ayraudi TaxID=303726 RepID=UPI003F6FFFDD